MPRMSTGNFITFYWSHSAQIVCIWLTFWAIRKHIDVDIPLSGHARIVRWAMVLFGFSLGDSTSSHIRVGGFLLALLFLCWPNVAYHLAKRLVRWPTASGKVVSVVESESGRILTYSFEHKSEMYGGTAKLKASATQYSEGQHIMVSYVPNNPNDSKLLLDDDRENCR